MTDRRKVAEQDSPAPENGGELVPGRGQAEVPKPSGCSGHRQRIRERFDRAGIEGFADHEILEYLLFYINRQKDTKPIAKALLQAFGGLPEVFAAKREQLLEVEGMGAESARFIQLVRGISQLLLRKKAYGRAPSISSASDLLQYLAGSMANLPEEEFRVVFVDNANSIIRDEVISKGVENQTAVYPKQVIRRALALHATGIVVVHNHPTGQVHPSPADREITMALLEAAKALDIRLLDHLILGREGKGYFSFREEGLIP